jgi:hypothetical protein
MNIYLENKYLDFEKILSIDIPFIFIIGGRGTGKTYGALKYAIDKCLPHMLMRRTQTQTDLINDPEFTPYKKLNQDQGWDITTKTLKKNLGGIFENIEEGGTLLGYTCALSTIKNIRGFDASNIKLLIYDEFIPEKHERPLKGEADALWNAYETINRNRELHNEKPLQLVALANSNDLANPIFMDLGVIRTVQKMQAKGQNSYINRDRKFAIFDLGDSKISVDKNDTVLYTLKKGSEFADMSLGNRYNNEVAGRIKSKPIKEYRPIVKIGELCIYEHKHDGSLYASTHKTGSPPEYGLGDIEKARFRNSYIWVWHAYISNSIEFEEYLCEILLKKIFI